jgi:hypothetical protein
MIYKQKKATRLANAGSFSPSRLFFFATVPMISLFLPRTVHQLQIYCLCLTGKLETLKRQVCTTVKLRGGAEDERVGLKNMFVSSPIFAPFFSESKTIPHDDSIYRERSGGGIVSFLTMMHLSVHRHFGGKESRLTSRSFQFRFHLGIMPGLSLWIRKGFFP